MCFTTFHFITNILEGNNGSQLESGWTGLYRPYIIFQAFSLWGEIYLILWTIYSFCTPFIPLQMSGNGDKTFVGVSKTNDNQHIKKLWFWKIFLQGFFKTVERILIPYVHCVVFTLLKDTEPYAELKSYESFGFSLLLKDTWCQRLILVSMHADF